MNKILFAACVLFATASFADDAKNEWHDTTLSEATIAKIQEVQFQYKKCVSDEMQKPGYQQIDTRNATDGIIKQCEPALTKIREVYTSENIPGSVADRHLKQLRVQTSRNVLQNLMFVEAARKSGQ
ncbi:MAG: hypothetical protein ACXW0Q_07090 [Methylovulum sp.]